MESNKVIDQPNGLPQCPECKKPTTISPDGYASVTAAYYPPRIAPDGTNLNPDRNTRTQGYTCCDCGCYFTMYGNYHDGFAYGTIRPKKEPEKDETRPKGAITFNGTVITCGIASVNIVDSSIDPTETVVPASVVSRLVSIREINEGLYIRLFGVGKGKTIADAAELVGNYGQGINGYSKTLSGKFFDFGEPYYGVIWDNKICFKK